MTLSRKCARDSIVFDGVKLDLRRFIVEASVISSGKPPATVKVRSGRGWRRLQASGATVEALTVTLKDPSGHGIPDTTSTFHMAASADNADTADVSPLSLAQVGLLSLNTSIPDHARPQTAARLIASVAKAKGIPKLPAPAVTANGENGLQFALSRVGAVGLGLSDRYPYRPFLSDEIEVADGPLAASVLKMLYDPTESLLLLEAGPLVTESEDLDALTALALVRAAQTVPSFLDDLRAGRLPQVDDLVDAVARHQTAIDVSGWAHLAASVPLGKDQVPLWQAAYDERRIAEYALPSKLLKDASASLLPSTANPSWHTALDDMLMSQHSIDDRVNTLAGVLLSADREEFFAHEIEKQHRYLNRALLSSRMHVDQAGVLIVETADPSVSLVRLARLGLAVAPVVVAVNGHGEMVVRADPSQTGPDGARLNLRDSGFAGTSFAERIVNRRDVDSRVSQEHAAKVVAHGPNTVLVNVLTEPFDVKPDLDEVLRSVWASLPRTVAADGTSFPTTLLLDEMMSDIRDAAALWSVSRILDGLEAAKRSNHLPAMSAYLDALSSRLGVERSPQQPARTADLERAVAAAVAAETKGDPRAAERLRARAESVIFNV